MNGAHRAVSCHCGLGTVARQVLVEDANKRLAECFEPGPDGRPIIESILRQHPDLADRLRKVING